jgi:hypothetical protein
VADCLEQLVSPSSAGILNSMGGQVLEETFTNFRQHDLLRGSGVRVYSSFYTGISTNLLQH